MSDEINNIEAGVSTHGYHLRYQNDHDILFCTCGAEISGDGTRYWVGEADDPMILCDSCHANLRN